MPIAIVVQDSETRRLLAGAAVARNNKTRSTSQRIISKVPKRVQQLVHLQASYPTGASTDVNFHPLNDKSLFNCQPVPR